MIKKLLFLTLLAAITADASAQNFLFQQYFDGNDTLTAHRLQIDTAAGNIWQIGPPQKSVFDSAATSPNVIVTDTINTYPINDTSSFTVGLNTSMVNWAITAIRWTQKLDMDPATDGGIVEISTDSGQTWVNVFNDSNVYNFYGFHKGNADTLPDGNIAFTGTDSLWKDIWLCYGYTMVSQTDSIVLKFTFRSDATDSQKDGWMIDNMFVTRTFVHTVSEVDDKQTFLVYPTITNGIIKVAMGNEQLKIESILMLDMQGQVVQRHNKQTDKATLDISGLADGNYFVHIQSGDKIEVHKVLLSH
jgi:hypothetical protein